MPVRFRSSAPRAASSMAERQALNLCRSGFKSLVAHRAGVKGTGIPRDFKPRGLRVRLAPSALIPGGLLASHQGPEPWPRWFDPSPGSFAAAHGCGPALVRRVTRVGTGWRLHVLVAQQAEAPGRGPGGCGFKSRLAHRAPGSKDRTDFCKSASRGWHLAGAPLAGCSVGRGAAALDRTTTPVRFQPGQLMPA